MTEASRRDAEMDEVLQRLSGYASDTPPTPACLDAETAAAWLAGELPIASREATLAHVADCARCQQLLATLTRLEKEDAPAAEPAVTRPWWTYLVPIGVVATMIAIVVGLPRQTPSSPPAAPPKPAQTQALRDLESRFEPAPTNEKKEADNTVNQRKALDRDKSDAKTKLAERAQPAGSAAAPLQAASEPATKNAAVARAAPPPQAPAQQRAQDAVGTLRGNEQLKDAKVPGAVVIPSPDRNVQWRVRGAIVERSTDAGATWTETPIGWTADWTAGSAPSTSVCWLVGRGGAIARTTDGRTWERVGFLSQTDLSAVQASDAQTATITTADGRTFWTNDAGHTWWTRALQESPAAPFRD